MDPKEVESTAAQFEYYYYGLRRCRVLPEDGEVLDVSGRWSDNEPTGEYLDGTCAIGLAEREGGPLNARRALGLLGAYRGEFILLIGGWQSSPGEDPGEAVIKEAQALAAWRENGERIY